MDNAYFSVKFLNHEIPLATHKYLLTLAIFPESKCMVYVCIIIFLCVCEGMDRGRCGNKT